MHSDSTLCIIMHKLGIFVAPLCGSEENKMFPTFQQVHSNTVWPLCIQTLSQVLKLFFLSLQNHERVYLTAVVKSAQFPKELQIQKKNTQNRSASEN